MPKEKQNVAAVHAIIGEERVFRNIVDYRNVSVFAVTRYVESVNWGIVAKIDKAEAFIPINKLRTLFLFIVFGTAILIVFLTIPVSQFIVAKEEELDKVRSEIVSLATHQLRTPITAISWSLATLLSGDKGRLNKEQREVLERIRDSNRNMLDLVGGFLDVTKMESTGFVLERGEVELPKVADLILEELASQISNKKIVVVKKYGKDVPHLNVGTKAARIIFQNLLSNAIKYVPEGGRVEVSIMKTVGGVSIFVKDNGCGIPEKAKGRIFLKLFRADNVREREPSGTGLGLYLLKLLVDKLGGRVWFESVEGYGTTFHVDLKS